MAGGRLNLAKALFGGLTLATQSRNIHKVLQQFQRTVGAYHSGLRLAEIVQGRSRLIEVIGSHYQTHEETASIEDVLLLTLADLSQAQRAFTGFGESFKHDAGGPGGMTAGTDQQHGRQGDLSRDVHLSFLWLFCNVARLGSAGVTQR